jgi:uncharacterized protein YkwD
MKNLVIALLCAGIVKSGSAITTINTTPNGEVTNVEVEWTKSTYTIKYSKNGRQEVLKGKHKIPSIDGMVLDAGANAATDPDAIVTPENMSYKLLDQLTWEECNKYRATKNLVPVQRDETIETAAAHHSYYQQFYSSLQHGEDQEIPHRQEFQENYNKVYGGAAEICLYNWGTLGGMTYREVAQKNIQQWANSPGHNAIMISNRYKYNGFGNCVQYSDKDVVNREMLEAYDPELLAEIERVVPEAIGASPSSRSVQIWSTGNFRSSEPQHPVVALRKSGGQTLSSTAPSDSGNEFRGTGADATADEVNDEEFDAGSPGVGSRAAARNSRAVALERDRADKKKKSKSGYTVLPRHPNAKSGFSRLKPNKHKGQSGNGGRGKKKSKRGRGYKKNQHRGCDAYM